MRQSYALHQLKLFVDFGVSQSQKSLFDENSTTDASLSLACFVQKVRTPSDNYKQQEMNAREKFLRLMLVCVNNKINYMDNIRAI